MAEEHAQQASPERKGSTLQDKILEIFGGQSPKLTAQMDDVLRTANQIGKLDLRPAAQFAIDHPGPPLRLAPPDPSPRITATSVQALESLARDQRELNLKMVDALTGLHAEAKDSGKWMRLTLWIALATLVVSGAALGVAIVVAQR